MNYLTYTMLLDESSDEAEAMDENDCTLDIDLDEDWSNSENAAAIETDTGFLLEARMPLHFIASRYF